MPTDQEEWDSRFGTKLGGEEGIVLRACLEISVGTLSYQRESLWGLARSRAWRPQPTSGIRPPCTYLLPRSNIHVSATVTPSQTRPLTDKKLSQQYVDSFKIIEKIDNLTYRLKLSNY